MVDGGRRPPLSLDVLASLAKGWTAQVDDVSLKQR
jgi:hypothetical protein